MSRVKVSLKAPEGNVVRLKITEFFLEPDGNQEGFLPK